MVKVLYIGTDDVYFHNLEKHFARLYPDEEFEFVKVWRDDADTFQSIVLKIILEGPQITFLDYSASPLKVLTLARSLPRILKRGSALIGLWDYLLGTPMLIKESNTTGVPFNHIKSGEFSDLVIQAMFLLKKEDGFPTDRFTKAEVYEKSTYMQASHAMRIGFMTKEYIHVEHDLSFPKEDFFQLSGEFKTPIPVEKFKVLRRLDENYYYNFSYVSDLAFVTEVNEREVEGESKAQKQWREQENKERTELNEKKVLDFIEQCDSVNRPKRTRVLIIDRELSLLKDAEKPIDSYPHSIRFFRHLSDDGSEMKKIRAGIICFSCTEEGREDLHTLMKTIKVMDHYKPFILVFRSSETSESLKKKFNYDRIMVDSNDFSLQQLLDFCQVYEQRGGREKANDGRDSYHDQEERIYIDKYSPESYLHYNFNIELRELSESWFSFQTATKLPLWGIFALKDPVNMCFTVVEQLKEPEWCREGNYQYLAVIHSIGETEKASLRRQVNQTIFEQTKSAEAESQKENQKSDQDS